MISAHQGSPELRITDADRDAAVEALGEHYLVGRLTKEEYDERAARASAARTASDLRPLFADLPRQGGDPVAEPPPPQGRAAWDAPRVVRGGWEFARAHPLLGVLAALLLLSHWPVVLAVLVAWMLWSRNGHRPASMVPHGHGHGTSAGRPRLGG